MRRMRYNKKRMYLIIICAVFVFMGVGYAYFSSSLSINGNVAISKNSWDVHFQNVFVTLGSANRSVVPTLSESNTKVTANISLNEPGDFYEFTVDVINNGSIDAMLSDISSNTLTKDQQNYLEYSLTYDDNTVIKSKDSLKAGSSDTIKVRVKYKENIDESLYPKSDQTLTLTLQTTYIQDDGTSVERVSKSLVKQIKKNAVLDNVASTYVTSSTGVDFSKISSDTNGKGVYLLASTKDDINPIYYYRGAVDNNNVKFAGFCWKIVRTTETGGVKLIYNGTPDSNGYCTNTTGEVTQIGTSAFNSNNTDNATDNAYVGYMYGTPGSSTYEDTHKNINNSTIKTVIDNWYQTNMTTYTKKLEDTVWCNDRSLSSGSGMGTSTTHYGARNRLVTNKIPSLVCAQDNDKFTVSTENGNGALTYPVALLTADEVAYAGGVIGTENSIYYLCTNQLYWSISPNYFLSGYAYELRMDSAGYLDVSIVSSPRGVRPSVSLARNTVFTSGDGTSNNPYVVE